MKGIYSPRQFKQGAPEVTGGMIRMLYVAVIFGSDKHQNVELNRRRWLLFEVTLGSGESYPAGSQRDLRIRKVSPLPFADEDLTVESVISTISHIHI